MLRGRIFRGIKPSVAVLVRTRSRPEFLARALASVENQTFGYWQLWILVDGVPCPETKKLIQTLKKKYGSKINSISIQRKKGEGLGELLNLGIRRTRSEFIAFLDDDDTWDPEFLEKCIGAMGDKNAVVAQSNLVEDFYQNGEWGSGLPLPFHEWQKRGISLFRLAEGVTYPLSALMVRRKVFRRIGYFHSTLPHKEDWEFSLRLHSIFPVVFLEERLANFHFRADATDVWQKNWIMDEGAHYASEIEIQNLFLRRDLAAGKTGLGYLLALSQTQASLFSRIEEIKRGQKKEDLF